MRPYKQMEMFKKAIEDCGLSDLGYKCQNSHGAIIVESIIILRNDWIVLLKIVTGTLFSFSFFYISSRC